MDEYISFPDEMHLPFRRNPAKKNSTFLCCTILKKCDAYFTFLPHTRSMHHFFKYPTIIDCAQTKAPGTGQRVGSFWTPRNQK